MANVRLQTQQFNFKDYIVFKTQMLNWANRFNIFCLLDNNGYDEANASFSCILAAGSKRSIKLSSAEGLAQLQSFYDERPCWLFGHFGYGLNDPASLQHLKPNTVGFNPGFFFEPKVILKLDQSSVTIYADDTEEIARTYSGIIEQSIASEQHQESQAAAQITSSISKEKYFHTIAKLREHIRRGDCYEINFCQHFYCQDTVINVLSVYDDLVKSSPHPFGAFYKLNDKYCLCASPERFLKKTGRNIISQPIKGTSSRILSDPELDAQNRSHLSNSAKEKSENVMIVDLVRNDLSKICKEASVSVQELFGVYSFPQVHQLISTVKGVLRQEITFSKAIEATFPMGSMTGAPKFRVIQLIDEYEEVARGLFSGSIGYITPDEDFDFNVVIRSIFYNEQQKYVSFSAGSGITFYSDASDEYDECLLKAKAIRQLLIRPNKLK